MPIMARDNFKTIGFLTGQDSPLWLIASKLILCDWLFQEL